VYASQAQEAFLEGHVAAFEACGGVPFRHVRYDNLTPAVAKVLTGRNRAETGRWLSFRAYYGFEAFYCIPGQEGAHEKGLASHCTSWARCGGYWLGRFLLPAGRPVALRGVTSGSW